MSPAKSSCRRRLQPSIYLSRCGTPGPWRRRFRPTGGASRRIHSTRLQPIGRGRSCCRAICCFERSSTTPAPISPMPLNGSPPANWGISMSQSPTPSCRSPAFLTSTSVIWPCRRRRSAIFCRRNCRGDRADVHGGAGHAGPGAGRSARAYRGSLSSRDRRRLRCRTPRIHVLPRARDQTRELVRRHRHRSGNRRFRAVERRRHVALPSLRAAVPQPRELVGATSSRQHRRLAQAAR